MKTYRLLLTEQDGGIVSEYLIGAYKREEADMLFAEQEKGEHMEIDTWVEVDGNNDNEITNLVIVDIINQY